MIALVCPGCGRLLRHLKSQRRGRCSKCLAATPIRHVHYRLMRLGRNGSIRTEMTGSLAYLRQMATRSGRQWIEQNTDPATLTRRDAPISR